MRGAHAFLDANLSFRDIALACQDGNRRAGPYAAAVGGKKPAWPSAHVSHLRKRASEFVGCGGIFLATM
jgi:hypothetical protein